MSRALLYLLLMLAMILQGVVAVGADFIVEETTQEHCAGHDAGNEHCVCCPDGTTHAGCLVQCSAFQVPAMMHAPARVASAGQNVSPLEYSVQTRFYRPLNPPPIS